MPSILYYFHRSGVGILHVTFRMRAMPCEQQARVWRGWCPTYCPFLLPQMFTDLDLIQIAHHSIDLICSFFYGFCALLGHGSTIWCLMSIVAPSRDRLRLIFRTAELSKVLSKVRTTPFNSSIHYQQSSLHPPWVAHNHERSDRFSPPLKMTTLGNLRAQEHGEKAKSGNCHLLSFTEAAMADFTVSQRGSNGKCLEIRAFREEARECDLDTA